MFLRLSTLLLAAVGVPLLTHGGSLHASQGITSPAAVLDDEITVMTLNLGHGRGAERHQALASTAQLQAHLDAVGGLARHHEVDLLALQEVEGASRIGDMARRLSRNAPFHHYIRGRHTVGLGLDYGTAVLSRGEVVESQSQAFAPSPPTFTKGFVRSTVRAKGSPTGRVDVVSVHLDFANPLARARQIDQLIDALEGRPHPRVIMGDFNMEDSRQLRRLQQSLDLHASEDPTPTFDRFSLRIDWVLCSRELVFGSHEVLDAGYSDHRPVLATLQWRR